MVAVCFLATSVLLDEEQVRVQSQTVVALTHSVAVPQRSAIGHISRPAVLEHRYALTCRRCPLARHRSPEVVDEAAQSDMPAVVLVPIIFGHSG